MANPRTIARLEARILERAAYCLEFEIKDPRASFITITRVELSKDITHGKIFYSVLGSPADLSKTAHMLESAAGFIQRRVAKVLEVRRMPHLRWMYDESIARAASMSEAIKKALVRDERIQQMGRAPDTDQDEPGADA